VNYVYVNVNMTLNAQ